MPEAMKFPYQYFYFYFLLRRLHGRKKVAARNILCMEW